MMRPYKPFPLEQLPEPVRSYIKTCAEALPCDPCLIALPLISALAAAIGNSRVIRLKHGWNEPAIVWSAVICRSGTMKSPALDCAMRFVIARQSRAAAEYQAAYAEWQIKHAEWAKRYKVTKTYKSPAALASEPPMPVLERFRVDDTTNEALLRVLASNPRGIVLIKDEIAGWINSFDRYRAGKGGDIAQWLTMHGGRSVVVDRVSLGGIPIFVARASVSITGTVQPAILAGLMTSENRSNGLAARFLFAHPPHRRKRWNEVEPDPTSVASMEALFDRLYGLTPDRDENDNPLPVSVPLTEEAVTRWGRFVDEWAERQAGILDQDRSAALSKLEGYAARLALIVHLVGCATGEIEAESSACVGIESIEAGIALVEWFAHEMFRVYDGMATESAVREQSSLVDFIRSKGGMISVRDLQRAKSRRFAQSADAAAALDELVVAGIGQWVKDGPRNPGRRSQVFRLADNSTVDKNPPGAAA